MYAKISALTEYLPVSVLSNSELSLDFPEWPVGKIASKTGISQRHIASEDEFASDLAIAAGAKLFQENQINPSSIDYLLLCTQSPDYFLPTTACIVQDKLGLSRSIGALDINLGCSGYIYSLGMAKGLLETGQASKLLLITADTYSKFLNPKDKSVRTIFGDGASATLIEATASESAISLPAYGTDGSGAHHLIVPTGGLRNGQAIAPKSAAELRGLASSKYDLFMDGPEIFNFTLNVVPESLESTLAKSGLSIGEVDLFVFHQANKFMLDHLRNRLSIPEDKFYISMGETGNTVSSTIPIALSNANREGVLKPGMKVLLLGFGVGLSWAGTVITWK